VIYPRTQKTKERVGRILTGQPEKKEKKSKMVPKEALKKGSMSSSSRAFQAEKRVGWPTSACDRAEKKSRRNTRLQNVEKGNGLKKSLKKVLIADAR